ncbi:MAG: glycosyltransferase family 4 protein [Candidatus Thermoplasmatota archaeon]|nr:glycosyltransferase family 4 protein [Candidatus Thermoplasmatota archaeon]
MKSEAKKRIVMVSGHNPYDGRIFHKEAKSLVGMGYRATIVGWDFKGDGLKKVDNGVKLEFHPFRLPKGKNIFSKARFFRKKVMPIIQKKILSHKPDIIHCHDLETLPVGVKAARRAKCKLIYDCHEYWPEMEWHQNKIWGVVTWFLEKINVRKVDAVITVSDHLADKFKRKKIPTEVLFNTTRYEDAKKLVNSEKKFFCPELGLPNDKIIIGYVGAMNYRMDFDSYVKALSGLDDNIIMVFVGGAEARLEKLKKLAEGLGVAKRLITHSWVDYDTCLKYIYSFDIGLQALISDSMAEHTFPTKIFEYMALKVPYVAPDLQAMADFTRKWNSGYVLDGRSPDDIIKTITDAVSDPERNKKIGMKSHKNVKEKFSWEIMEKRLGKFYERILR